MAASIYNTMTGEVVTGDEYVDMILFITSHRKKMKRGEE
jgi:hypothetical protein